MQKFGNYNIIIDNLAGFTCDVRRRIQMSFFGLTRLGYENPMREHMKDPPLHPVQVFRSGLYRDPKFHLPPPSYIRRSWTDYLPPDRCYSLATSDRTCQYGPGHENSFSEFKRMRVQGIANPKGLSLHLLCITSACFDVASFSRGCFQCCIIYIDLLFFREIVSNLA